MKKILSLIPIAALICLYSATSFADRDDVYGVLYHDHLLKHKMKTSTRLLLQLFELQQTAFSWGSI